MILIKIQGIEGDCKVEGYKGWFIAESISFGVGRKIEVAKKGGGQDIETSKEESQEISISKTVDATTVYLMYKAIQDRTPDDANRAGNSGSDANKSLGAEIHFVEAVEDSVNKSRGLKAYLKIKLGKTLIKSWSIDGDGDDRPSETISLWYNQIAMKYRSTTDGKVFQTMGDKSWDQAKSCTWDHQWKDPATGKADQS